MSYTKTNQTKKTEIKRKVCSECNRDRMLKFYSSKRAYKCNSCKAKTRRLRKKRKGKKAKLKRELDDLWSKAVKLVGKCEYCSKTDYLNAHHIYSRSNHAVRWNLDNGICLCSGHHTLSSKFSAHKTPLEFTEFIIEKRGEAWYNKLREKANSVVKYTLDDYKQIKKRLNSRINK
jgi:hypothetical protein